jgi:predicted nucleic acid-binding protein
VILVDTSVWVDHLRAGDPVLSRLLNGGEVLTHPFVIGELALGALRNREQLIGMLLDLPGAVVADEAEVLHFIGRHELGGSGIGYVDAHLLTASRLTTSTRLWTRDKRLGRVADRLALAVNPSH